MKSYAIFVSALAATLAVGLLPVRADETCKAPELKASEPASNVGRKAWIFDPIKFDMFMPVSEWPKADILEQIGPVTWVTNSKLGRLGYGQEVEILEWQQGNYMAGVYKVRLPDGGTAFVMAKTVQFFEFWKCPVETLLEKRPSGVPGVGDVNHLYSAWVRISDPSATAVDDSRRWVPKETLAGYAFAICNGYQPNIKKFRPWEEPLQCQGYAPGVRGGKSFSIGPAAVEPISPTSMKILFAS
jgi:hypothetical protein